MITAIVLVSTTHDEIAPGCPAPDEDIVRLGALLNERWRGASLYREVPPIWFWAPLVEAGVILLAGIVAVAEFDLDGDESERAEVRATLRTWLDSSLAGQALRVQLVWANQ